MKRRILNPLTTANIAHNLFAVGLNGKQCTAALPLTVEQENAALHHPAFDTTRQNPAHPALTETIIQALSLTL